MQVFVCEMNLKEFKTVINDYLAKGYRMVPGTMTSDAQTQPTFMVLLEGPSASSGT